MEYKYKKPRFDKNYFVLRDIASSYDYGPTNENKRIQVVMPAIVVDELDKEFPNIDRSKLLTQIAIDALLLKKRYADNTALEELANEEQYDLNRMLEYLEEREND